MTRPSSPDAWQRGEPVTGGAAHRMAEAFALVQRDVEAFQGTVDEREKRLNDLLRRYAQTLHIGILSDCHFSDPRQARCLQKCGVHDADRPLITACDPSRCGNALITREHVGVWQQSLIQIKTLRRDRTIPKNERERLGDEERRIEEIIAPLLEDAS